MSSDEQFIVNSVEIFKSYEETGAALEGIDISCVLAKKPTPEQLMQRQNELVDLVVS